VRPLEVLDPLLHYLRRQQRHRHLHSTAETSRRGEGVSYSVQTRAMDSMTYERKSHSGGSEDVPCKASG
jgi:hypothetical protein